MTNCHVCAQRIFHRTKHESNLIPSEGFSSLEVSIALVNVFQGVDTQLAVPHMILNLCEETRMANSDILLEDGPHTFVVIWPLEPEVGLAVPIALWLAAGLILVLSSSLINSSLVIAQLLSVCEEEVELLHFRNSRVDVPSLRRVSV